MTKQRPRAGFAHWKRLHTGIFSTMPEYKAGIMRQSSDETFEWIKHRRLDNGMVYEVLYAHSENPGVDADRVYALCLRYPAWILS